MSNHLAISDWRAWPVEIGREMESTMAPWQTLPLLRELTGAED
jgi:hypothetical protein